MTMLAHKRYDRRIQRMAGYRVEIYWRADSLGVGPCMSLYVGSIERLRFDLFTPAHRHVFTMPGQPRIYYPEGLTREAYIDLAIEDLARDHPPAARVRGWARDQLLKVTGPTVAAPPISARDRQRLLRAKSRRR